MAKKAAKTGRELERRVAQAYREMGARKVEHDVELAGNQVDIYRTGDPCSSSASHCG
jgi:hypothetical protein